MVVVLRRPHEERLVVWYRNNCLSPRSRLVNFTQESSIFEILTLQHDTAQSHHVWASATSRHVMSRNVMARHVYNSNPPRSTIILYFGCDTFATYYSTINNNTVSTNNTIYYHNVSAISMI